MDYVLRHGVVALICCCILLFGRAHPLIVRFRGAMQMRQASPVATGAVAIQMNQRVPQRRLAYFIGMGVGLGVRINYRGRLPGRPICQGDGKASTKLIPNADLVRPTQVLERGGLGGGYISNNTFRTI